MENTLSTSKIDLTEIAITAGIVLVVGTLATLAALYAKEAIDKQAAKKKSDKKDPAKAV